MTATALTASELGELASAFGLGALHEHRRLEAGTINSNYRLECERGRFFLRINEGKSDADVAYEVALIDAIVAAGVPTPVPLRTGSGQRFVHHRSKQVNVFPWVAGEHREGGRLGAVELRALGSALATLHAATAPLLSQFGRPSIYSTARIGERLETIDSGDDDELSEVLALARAELGWLEERESRRASLPRAVIHGDLFPDNVLFQGDQISALLDFEQASRGAPLYDVAVCLNAWCHDGDELDLELGRALIAGYGAACAADLLWIECRAAAVRFAVTRITDVHLVGLSRPGKDYREYAARLRSWQQGGSAVIEALL